VTTLSSVLPHAQLNRAVEESDCAKIGRIM